MENTVMQLPPVKDLDEFNRLNDDKVNVNDIPDEDKRYIMFIEKKKNLRLPLTFEEQKIINIIA